MRTRGPSSVPGWQLVSAEGKAYSEKKRANYLEPMMEVFTIHNIGLTLSYERKL